MNYTSSNIFSAADSAKRIAPDVAAQAASKAASKLTQSPLVAQLTVRAIESALEKTHVALPGNNDKAAILELRKEAVLETKSSADARLASASGSRIADQRALDQLKDRIATGNFSIDDRAIATSLIKH
jgi:anti-sigma28 factor (negative regulator of flagellin synthesis)